MTSGPNGSKEGEIEWKEKMENNRENEKMKKEGYYRHFILMSIIQKQEKLFCQTFS
jgi:hypothetical protein